MRHKVGHAHHDEQDPNESKLDDPGNRLDAAPEALPWSTQLDGTVIAKWNVRLTRTRQHRMIPHCMTMLSHTLVSGAAQRRTEGTHMLSIPEAEDVLPSSKNHGLNPSDDLAEIILQC